MLESSRYFYSTAPGPSYREVNYDANCGPHSDVVDRLKIPTEPVPLVRLDYFDKLECTENGSREFQGKENWLRWHWSRMNRENGRPALELAQQEVVETISGMPAETTLLAYYSERVWNTKSRTPLS